MTETVKICPDVFFLMILLSEQSSDWFNSSFCNNNERASLSAMEKLNCKIPYSGIDDSSVRQQSVHETHYISNLLGKVLLIILFLTAWTVCFCIVYLSVAWVLLNFAC